MDLAQILFGLTLLIAGHKLFWLFVGAGGFWAGYKGALTYFYNMPDWTFLAAVVCGFLGLIFAFFLQWLAIVCVGFSAGVFLFFHFWTSLSGEINFFFWPFALASGVAGSLFLKYFFKPSVIVVSSLMGAGLIVHGIPVEPILKLLLAGGLFVLGMGIQMNYPSDFPRR